MPTRPVVLAPRTATFVVAASGAPASVKARADYVCDGTADEVEIQAAMNALPASGGIVQLMGTTFNIAAKLVSIRPDVSKITGLTLRGERNVTSLKLATNADCRIFEDTNEATDVTIEYLIFDGNGANQGSGDYLLYSRMKRLVVSHVTFKDAKGLALYSYTDDTVLIEYCKVSGSLGAGGTADIYVNSKATRARVHHNYVAMGAIDKRGIEVWSPDGDVHDNIVSGGACCFYFERQSFRLRSHHNLALDAVTGGGIGFGFESSDMVSDHDVAKGCLKNFTWESSGVANPNRHNRAVCPVSIGATTFGIGVVGGVHDLEIVAPEARDTRSGAGIYIYNSGAAPNGKVKITGGHCYDGQGGGSHTGDDAAAVLTDNTQNWVTNALIGMTLLNVTDGSSTVVTANTPTTVTGTLAGGTDNDWDTGDVYSIVAARTQTYGITIGASQEVEVDNVDVENNLTGAISDSSPTVSKIRNCKGWNTSGQIEHHTAGDTLTIAENGSVHTNLGAGDTIVLALPQTVPTGFSVKFAVMAAFELRIDPGAAGGIYINGAKQADNMYISADDEGESVELVADGNGDWVAVGAVGTWSVEAP